MIGGLPDPPIRWLCHWSAGDPLILWLLYGLFMLICGFGNPINELCCKRLTLTTYYTRNAKVGFARLTQSA